MEKEYFNTLMESIIKENGKMKKDIIEAFFMELTESNIKENG
jgi:hypothetical protein